MPIPAAGALVDVSLLLLRLMLAAVFAKSGWSHVRNPEERGESIGLPPAATFTLGAVEVTGSAMLVVGLWPQLAALALMAVMLGAIYKKMFVWKTGFWGEDGGGWYYDLFYFVANLVVLATGGGAIAIT